MRQSYQCGSSLSDGVRVVKKKFISLASKLDEGMHNINFLITNG